MDVSRRIRGLTGGQSDGWDVFYKGRALAAAGEPVIELTIGEHDVGTDPAILAAMDASARGGRTGYATVQGDAGLRAAIAARVAARTGVPTTAANVLVTPGGQAGLLAALMAACDPGDTALFLDPYYATYPGTIRAASARPRAVRCAPDQGFMPDADAIQSALDATTRVLVLNTPNNPTGAVYTRDVLSPLCRVVRDAGLWLVSDEVYDSQVWDGAHVSPRSLPGMADRTLVVGSMSKSHAMTGSRIGWIVGPETAIAQLVDLATHSTYGVPGFIQEAARFALEAGPELEARVTTPFRRRRDIVLDLLAGQDLVGLARPAGGMYAMLDIRATGLSGTAFAEGLLEAERIAVMPGESFGSAAAGHLRVALTTDDTRLRDALERLLAFAARMAAPLRLSKAL